SIGFAQTLTAQQNRVGGAGMDTQTPSLTRKGPSQERTETPNWKTGKTTPPLWNRTTRTRVSRIVRPVTRSPLAGANVLAVSRMLGHKDPSVTLRIYADLFDSDLDAVAVNLDARIAESVQSVSKAPADRRRPRGQSAGLAASTFPSVECPRGDLNPHAR